MVNNNLFMYSLFRPPDASASWAALDPHGKNKNKNKNHPLKEEGREKKERRKGEGAEFLQERRWMRARPQYRGTHSLIWGRETGLDGCPPFRVLSVNIKEKTV